MNRFYSLWHCTDCHQFTEKELSEIVEAQVIHNEFGYCMHFTLSNAEEYTIPLSPGSKLSSFSQIDLTDLKVLEFQRFDVTIHRIAESSLVSTLNWKEGKQNHLNELSSSPSGIGTIRNIYTNLDLY